MKVQTPKDDLKNCGLPPQIFYKPDPTIGKTPEEKLDSLKVNIKTQPGERDSKTFAINVPLFWTGSTKALLKFITLLKNIIWGQDLSTGTHKFWMTRNLIVGEALWVFDQHTWDRGTETNTNCKIVMKNLITQLLPPKALQLQKISPKEGTVQASRYKNSRIHLPDRRYGGVPREVPSFWDRSGRCL